MIPVILLSLPCEPSKEEWRLQAQAHQWIPTDSRMDLILLRLVELLPEQRDQMLCGHRFCHQPKSSNYEHKSWRIVFWPEINLCRKTSV